MTKKSADGGCWLDEGFRVRYRGSRTVQTYFYSNQNIGLLDNLMFPTN